MVSPPEAWPWSLDSDPDRELDNESHRLESGSTGQGTLLRLRARCAPDLVTPPELRGQELAIRAALKWLIGHWSQSKSFNKHNNSQC